MYNGVAVLDERGEATITLPRYFPLINASPRYSLTPLGAPMPMLHIAEEISESALGAGQAAGPGDEPPECRFRIGGGAAGARVSWEVKARRNDCFVREHGAPVELDKPAGEAGTYQHPGLYQKGPGRGLLVLPGREAGGPSVPRASR
ncbi:MAG: hypothetical protein WAZ94_04810 [Phycisphaerales bacterium]